MERKQQKKEVRYTVRMDARLARKIERYAKREEFEVAEAIRRMLRAFFREMVGANSDPGPSVG